MKIVDRLIGLVTLGAGIVLGQVLQRMGFTIYRLKPICFDPATTATGPGATGCGPNPLQCFDTQASVMGPTGQFAEYPECGEGPRTKMVATEAGLKGLDAYARAQTTFAPSSQVEVSVMHFGSPGRIEAVDVFGTVAAMVTMGPMKKVEQHFTLRGANINRILVIPGSPTDHTLVLGWCH